MTSRRIVVLAAVALAYGCGGNDSNGILTPQDGAADANANDGSGSGEDATTDSGTSTDKDSGDANAIAQDAGDASPLTDSAPDGDASATSDSAVSDGPVFDGNPACTGTHTACLVDTDAGTIASGLCASNVCAPCTTATDDSLCRAAYGGDAGAGFICVAGSCIAGNCHDDSACGGTTPACASNACTACDGVSSGVYYVDPSNGSDAASSTGSDSAGGRSKAMCAFKTMTHALAVIGAPSTATKIVVIGPSTVSAGETFPFVVPQNVVVVGQGSVTIDVPATTASDAGVAIGTGFVMAKSASGLESVVIDGQSLGGAAGILVKAGSAASTYLKNVTVKNFPAGAGIAASGSGVVTLNEGVTLTKNLRGLTVSDTASVVSSNSNAANPVVFAQNAQDGIVVSASASVSLTGAAGVFGAGSIVISQNGSGVIFKQAGPGVNMPQSLLDGLSVWKNTTYGLDLQGGSRVRVRHSYIGANATGVEIRTSTVSASNDTSYIDLGTGSDFGMNTLQSLAPSDGGPNAQNASAGVCYAVLPNSSQTLSADGNYWVNASGTAPIDCTGASPGQLSNTTVCTGGVDVGGSGVQLTGGAGKNTANVDHCSL